MSTLLPVLAAPSLGWSGQGSIISMLPCKVVGAQHAVEHPVRPRLVMETAGPTDNKLGGFEHKQIAILCLLSSRECCCFKLEMCLSPLLWSSPSPSTQTELTLKPCLLPYNNPLKNSWTGLFRRVNQLPTVQINQNPAMLKLKRRGWYHGSTG